MRGESIEGLGICAHLDVVADEFFGPNSVDDDPRQCVFRRIRPDRVSLPPLPRADARGRELVASFIHQDCGSNQLAGPQPFERDIGVI